MSSALSVVRLLQQHRTQPYTVKVFPDGNNLDLHIQPHHGIRSITSREKTNHFWPLRAWIGMLRKTKRRHKKYGWMNATEQEARQVKCTQNDIWMTHVLRLHNYRIHVNTFESGNLLYGTNPYWNNSINPMKWFSFILFHVLGAIYRSYTRFYVHWNSKHRMESHLLTVQMMRMAFNWTSSIWIRYRHSLPHSITLLPRKSKVP